MISVLISILVMCLIASVVYWIVAQIPLPPPFKQIVLVVMAIIFLIWLLSMFGFVGEPVIIRVR